MANNRADEAQKVLSRYHAGSDTPNELVRWEMTEITKALEREKHQKSASYMHFFRTGMLELQ